MLSSIIDIAKKLVAKACNVVNTHPALCAWALAGIAVIEATYRVVKYINARRKTKRLEDALNKLTEYVCGSKIRTVTFTTAEEAI